MKNKLMKRMNQYLNPDVHVAISYKYIYDDFETVDPSSFIKDIPTIPLINYIIKLQNRVLYAFSDSQTQLDMIREMCNYTSKNNRSKIWKFQKEYKNPLLITNETTFLMFRLALSNYCPFDNSDELDLYDDEKGGVYKAILYCNQLWTDKSCRNITADNYKNNVDSLSLAKLSILIDLPIVEFKYYKDFRAQIYKAICFFEFCEKDSHFSKFLPYFCGDYNVNDWRTYLQYLFKFMCSSLKSHCMTVSDDQFYFIQFINQYLIDFKDKKLRTLWLNKNGFKYIRDKFVIKITNNEFMLLNTNLLVDKMFQGMKFDFYNTLKRHGCMTKSGRLYSSWSTFSSEIGNSFSEHKLLYPLLHKCYDDKAEITLDGEMIKSKNIVGEPDFYIRDNNILYIIEFKDLTLGDDIKFSDDADYIYQEITNRLCCDEVDSNGSHKRKGGGQLLWVLNEIFNGENYSRIDSEINKITDVFPIIVTTDTSFSALGVSAMIVHSFDDICKKNNYSFGNRKINVPVIIDFDTLLRMSCYLYNEQLILCDILRKYILNNINNLCSFKTYMVDEFFNKKQNNNDENKFLFSNILYNRKNQM